MKEKCNWCILLISFFNSFWNLLHHFHRPLNPIDLFSTSPPFFPFRFFSFVSNRFTLFPPPLSFYVCFAPRVSLHSIPRPIGMQEKDGGGMIGWGGKAFLLSATALWSFKKLYFQCKISRDRRKVLQSLDAEIRQSIHYTLPSYTFTFLRAITWHNPPYTFISTFSVEVAEKTINFYKNLPKFWTLGMLYYANRRNILLFLDDHTHSIFLCDEKTLSISHTLSPSVPHKTVHWVRRVHPEWIKGSMILPIQCKTQSHIHSTRSLAMGKQPEGSVKMSQKNIFFENRENADCKCWKNFEKHCSNMMYNANSTDEWNSCVHSSPIWPRLKISHINHCQYQ